MFNKRAIRGVGVLPYKITGQGKQLVLQMEGFDPEYKKQVRRAAGCKSLYKHVSSVWEKPEGMVHLRLKSSTRYSIEQLISQTIREVIKTIKMVHHRLHKSTRKARFRASDRDYIHQPRLRLQTPTVSLR